MRSRATTSRILVEPEASLVKQYVALLATEGVTLEFTDAAITEIAYLAAEINEQVENIGARRLHTVMERLVEESASPPPTGPETRADRSDYVRTNVSRLVEGTTVPLYPVDGARPRDTKARRALRQSSASDCGTRRPFASSRFARSKN